MNLNPGDVLEIKAECLEEICTATLVVGALVCAVEMIKDHGPVLGVSIDEIAENVDGFVEKIRLAIDKRKGVLKESLTSN